MEIGLVEFEFHFLGVRVCCMTFYKHTLYILIVIRRGQLKNEILLSINITFSILITLVSLDYKQTLGRKKNATSVSQDRHSKFPFFFFPLPFFQIGLPRDVTPNLRCARSSSLTCLSVTRARSARKKV